MRRVILTADDFGLSEAVNEGIERAHREGALTATSLMVAGAAAKDAVRRARRLPGLAVGLHLVLVEGRAASGQGAVPDLVDGDGQFAHSQVRAAFGYAARPVLRRQLAREVRAQFEAFAATGLGLDHADAHKHMHLHPLVGRLMIGIGREFGLRAVRIPHEPPATLAACGHRAGLGDPLLAAWSAVLRRQAHAAGMVTNDHAFGVAWSGHMTAARLATLIPRLPPGLSEIYFHPAARRDPLLERLMPTYEHEAELQALTGAGLRDGLASAGVGLTSYGAVVAGG